MSEIFRPMLACDTNLDELRWPKLASPKLDGVRAIVRDGFVYSRSNKPIPNAHVQRTFGHLEHHDGELIVGSPTSKTCYRDTVSGVMSRDGTPLVTFHVFDHVEVPVATYIHRAKRIRAGKFIIKLQQTLVRDLDELLAMEEDVLAAGYEGLILRSPDAPYKNGRSTVKEGFLLKLKRFVDDEAVVIGFEERMHNGNEAVVSELGRTKRSSHQAGKSGRGDLGALVVRGCGGSEFNIGTGFNDAERAAIWDDRDRYLGRIAKFKHFPVGAKELPRHPVFLGWRDRIDT